MSKNLNSISAYLDISGCPFLSFLTFLSINKIPPGCFSTFFNIWKIRECCTIETIRMGAGLTTQSRLRASVRNIPKNNPKRGRTPWVSGRKDFALRPSFLQASRLNGHKIQIVRYRNFCKCKIRVQLKYKRTFLNYWGQMYSNYNLLKSREGSQRP